MTDFLIPDFLRSFLNPDYLYNVLMPIFVIILAAYIGKQIDSFLAHSFAKSRLSVLGGSGSADTPTPLEIFVLAMKGLPINLCVGLALYWFVRFSTLPQSAEKLITCLIFTNIVYTITRTVARAAAQIVDINTRVDSAPNVKNSILINCVRCAIYAIGVLTVLEYYQISIAPFIAALGVGGMAVALGLQDTMANFFSGFHMLLSRQLKVGEYISLSSGETGRITDITLRYTSILTPAGNDILIPNAKLAGAVITNFNRPLPETTVIIPVSISYSSDLELVESVTKELTKQTMDELGIKLIGDPAIRFTELGDFSINFNLLITTDRLDAQGLIKHAVIKNLINRYRKENIEIPFPVRQIIH
ncbi:MAG: mechanosensitive ion channel family protein [Selenomonadaceae bacterium]|nr:mechanosensitive ion channel family protein [Selenomonadaceae bacterium]